MLRPLRLYITVGLLFIGGSFKGVGATTKAITPSQDLQAAVNALIPGDTLQLHAGTYTQPISTCPSNVTITNFPGETAILRPSSGGSGGDVIRMTGPIGVTIKGLVIDGSNVSAMGVRISGASTGIVVDSCEIGFVRNANGDGVFIQDDTSINNIIRNNYIHDIGTANLHHGIYCRSSGNQLIGNRIDKIAGYGIHVYHSGATNVNNNTVSGNQISNYNQVAGSSAGIILSSGMGNRATNNTINGPGKWGIQIDYNAVSAVAQGNNINGTSIGVYIGSQSTGANVSNNNICGTGTPVSNSGINTVQSGNGCNGQVIPPPGNVQVGNGSSGTTTTPQPEPPTPTPAGTNMPAVAMIGAGVLIAILMSK